MDYGRQEAADSAPLDRHGQHAVHAEHDEEIVPHHGVTVEWKAAPGISEPEESTTLRNMYRMYQRFRQVELDLMV